MKVRTSVLVAALSGAAGDVVAATWKGIQYIRTRVIPANPKSAAQTLQREAFARCVDCFQGLPVDIKDGLDVLGTEQQLAGFNVMMSDSVKEERTNHGHRIFPTNRHAPPLNGFTAAAGAGVEGDIDITWDVDDWLATDAADVYTRLKEAVGDEYTTPWVQDDTGALDMSTGAFTIAGMGDALDYIVAIVPYHTVNTAFGGGDFATATSKAA